jgi:sulfatase maturation enzyme AslB (radical SAM superfamily)
MRCNLNCSFCLNAKENSETFNRENWFRKKKFAELSGEDWVSALNRLDSSPQVPITFSGGEPFLHKDFVYIINHLKPELNIDILTNLYPNSHIHKQKLDNFLENVDPRRIMRDSPYASMRVSYHPEQMDPDVLIESVKKFKDKGFSIGIWSVLYPSPKQLSEINQMQFRCKDAGIEFRLKEFTGVYKGELYGDYSRYPDSIFSDAVKNCLCKTSELLIGTNGDVYRCHEDLYHEDNPIGSILDNGFEIDPGYRSCAKYGACHPCDVKVKTDYRQKLGHTSVEIRDVK